MFTCIWRLGDIYSSYKRIWILGDIHGSYIPIENFYQRNKNDIIFSNKTDCIILLGDVGLNYYLDSRDKEFKNKLEEYPFTYFCIRGNHEERVSNVISQNPKKWSWITFFKGGAWVENEYPNIIYASDCPSVYNINGLKTFIIPGAYSVDKYYRLKKGWKWFKNEQLDPDEMNLGREIIKQNPSFDLILSHTCPSIYVPTDLFLSTIDQITVDNTMERYLGEIEFIVDYKYWFWGHYHTFRRYPVGKDGKQRIMLSDQEAILLNNVINNVCKKY